MRAHAYAECTCSTQDCTSECTLYALHRSMVTLLLLYLLVDFWISLKACHPLQSY